MYLKKGDNVKIISGSDKGKTGSILRIFKDDNKVVIEGINIKKKHMKKRGDSHPGQILEIPAPINASNVMLLDPQDKKPTRVGFKDVNGKKIRVAMKSGQEIK